MLNPIPLHKRHMVGSKIKKDTKTWFKTSSWFRILQNKFQKNLIWDVRSWTRTFIIPGYRVILLSSFDMVLLTTCPSILYLFTMGRASPRECEKITAKNYVLGAC
jgi:hypothetical protein